VGDCTTRVGGDSGAVVRAISGPLTRLMPCVISPSSVKDACRGFRRRPKRPSATLVPRGPARPHTRCRAKNGTWRQLPSSLWQERLRR
jgi:hypothetical protein